MKNEKLKAVANDILAKCQEQGLSYDEMWELLTALRSQVEQARMNAIKTATAQKAVVKTF